MEVALPLKTTQIIPAPGAHPSARTVTQSVPHQLGIGGHIKLIWGAYFSPSEQDKQLAVNTIVAAMTGGLIDEETAVKAAALLFKVKDAGQMFKKIKEAKDADDEKAMTGPDGGVPPPPGAPPDPNDPTKPPADPNDPNAPPEPGAKPNPFAPKKPPFPAKTPPAGQGGKP